MMWNNSLLSLLFFLFWPQVSWNWDCDCFPWHEQIILHTSNHTKFLFTAPSLLARMPLMIHSISSTIVSTDFHLCGWVVSSSLKLIVFQYECKLSDWRMSEMQQKMCREMLLLVSQDFHQQQGRDSLAVYIARLEQGSCDQAFRSALALHAIGKTGLTQNQNGELQDLSTGRVYKYHLVWLLI